MEDQDHRDDDELELLARLRRRLPPGFHPDLVGSWNRKRASWQERVVNTLHLVRIHQATEYDPAECSYVRTRFCKYNLNLAFFDFDKESRPMRGRRLLAMTSRDRDLLEESVNVVSLRILKSGVGYPVRVFGTVLARDQIDYKCVYLFRRDRDDAQLINSPRDTLTLMDPCRGLAVSSTMFFEINLKIKGDDVCDDRVLSKGVIVHDACIGNGKTKLKRKLLTSWHSTLQLAYTPVSFAVQATLAVSILQGACEFTGEVIAWTSRNKNKIVLYDSEVAGTSTELGADGSVALSRRLVAVPVDEKLVLRIRVREGARQAACFEFTLGHLDDCRTFYEGEYTVQVKVEWFGILHTMRRNVLYDVGMTRVII